MGYSLPGSPVHGIFPARILEWAAAFLTRGSSWPLQGLNLSLLHCRPILCCWAIRAAFMFRCNYEVLGCKPWRSLFLQIFTHWIFLLESWKLWNDVHWSQIHYLEKACFIASVIVIGKSHVLLEYVTVPVWEMQGNEDVSSFPRNLMLWILDWEKFRSVPAHPSPSRGISPAESWKVLCCLFFPFGKVHPLFLHTLYDYSDRNSKWILFPKATFQIFEDNTLMSSSDLYFFFFSNTVPLVCSSVLSYVFFFIFNMYLFDRNGS